MGSEGNSNGWAGSGRRIAGGGSFWSGLGRGGDNVSLLSVAFQFFGSRVSHCSSGGWVWRSKGKAEAFNGLTSGIRVVMGRHGREGFVGVEWFR